MFDMFYEKGQYFIIRLTEKRNLFFKGKWYKATTLMKARKGRFKTILKFRSGEKECYVGFINVKITAPKKPLRLVCVYGLGEMPMMLATNRPIIGKDDVVKICRTYLSRWRIEEYFRFKKQHFRFENFRVRSLRAINALNYLLTFSISLLNRIMGKKAGHKLKAAVYEKANAVRKNVLFHYYRIAKGIAAILALARTGIKDWYKPRPRVKSPQLSLKLLC
jgi:transposase